MKCFGTIHIAVELTQDQQDHIEVLDETLTNEYDEDWQNTLEITADGVTYRGDDSFDVEQANVIIEAILEYLEINTPVVYETTYIDEHSVARGGGIGCIQRGKSPYYVGTDDMREVAKKNPERFRDAMNMLLN
jgi:hypothetical protein